MAAMVAYPYCFGNRGRLVLKTFHLEEGLIAWIDSRTSNLTCLEDRRFEGVAVW